MTDAAGKSAVVLIAHGTVESLDDLPEFLKNIRRGHDAPPELIAEVRRRYEAMGGKSPLLDITRSLAKKLEARVGMPTAIAMRLFHPYPIDVLRTLRDQGVNRIYTVPLAQHSAGVYGAAMSAAAKELGLETVNAPNWGQIPELTRAFADAIEAVWLTRHALPKVAQPARAARSRKRAIVASVRLWRDEVRPSLQGIALTLEIPCFCEAQVRATRGASFAPSRAS